MDSNQRTGLGGRELLLMFVAFLGIYLYGLLSALPGSVLATLERNHYLPNDSAVGTFLLINAVGAVLAYLVSGPIIDRVGKKFALGCGATFVAASMIGFALTIARVAPTSALLIIFGCSLVLGLGANAIVAAGHALVVDVASNWRNAALNLLDIFFGLGLASLPLVVQRIQLYGGLGSVFWLLAGISGLLFVLVLVPRFPTPVDHGDAAKVSAGSLFSNPSFVLLAVALFMYVGAEVAVGKWVVTLMQRDVHILASQGLAATQLQELTRASTAVQNSFFEHDPLGVSIVSYAQTTLACFAFALLAGRLVSSLVLGVLRANTFVLVSVGSAITTASLLIAFTTGSPLIVRVGLIAAGFGMGPIFPTSVGLASSMMPRFAGTAISLVMGVGFAGLLVIPPAVGYISDAVGGNVRTGLWVVIAAAAIMLLLHVVLALRERELGPTTSTS